MKRYGIRISLSPGNPMAMPHLLGDSWSAERWYDSAEERDRALIAMQNRLPNYRGGDTPAQNLSRIEDEQDA